MPRRELPLGHADGEAVVQNAVQILHVEVFFILELHAEKRRRGQLFGVAHDDDAVRAGNRPDGFAGGDLRSLVEYDEVELVLVQVQILRHRGRRHQHARTGPRQNVRDLIEEISEAHALHRVFLRTVQDDLFEVVLALFFRAGEIFDQAAHDFRAGQALVFLGQGAEPLGRLFQLEAGKTAEAVAQRDFVLGKVIVDALLEAG